MTKRARGRGKTPGGAGAGVDSPVPETDASHEMREVFPIVGVGASAGGMEAFIELLQHIQPDTGMAFVLLQHLDPTHDSYLSEALTRSIQLPVLEIRDGMQVEPDHVYVIPPNSEVGILKGVLVLFPRPTTRGLHLPIDFFFKALAADRGNQAIGVVLSGTGSDGAEGLRTIKAEDGIALAQDPASAKFSGMPEAAVGTGLVDFVLPIPALAEELMRIGRHPFVRSRGIEPGSPADEGALAKAIVLLRGAVGVDFSEYKPASIQRRMARRMAVHRISDGEDYLRTLREDAKEAQALFEDILIHVTSFFRNPEVFDALKSKVFPEILQQKSPGDTIRIWCAGCSSGEEAYSLVIALHEFLAEAGVEDVRVQLFGSDISELAIRKARNGLYPVSIARSVSPERLNAFFTQADGQGYRIKKAIREQCAFVKHNLASDPPFSRLDLVSCRNLLIYFGAELQKRALATFQFALNRPGFLLLGNAESITDGTQLFSVLDKETKIFSRSAASSSLRLTPRREPHAALLPSSFGGNLAASLPNFVRRTESMLLERYVPPGVIVNERMEILHFLGRTGPYLEPAAGQPQYDLLKMARKGLSAELRIVLSQAKKEKEKAAIRKSAYFEYDGVSRRCDLVVITISAPPASSEHIFAVLFEEDKLTAGRAGSPASKALPPDSRSAPDQRVAQLEAELETNKEQLRSIAAEQQGTNEELLSANEELMSSNEELQSLNEEIETAKEELQSTNEELSTLNEELHSRNGELNSLNSDLINILGSVEVPIVIVDQKRLIRRFTPKARIILNLLPADLGRPIDDIKPTLAIEDLDQKIADVIDTVAMHEEEVQARDGRWHRLQIRPYLTVDKVIDGAVVSIVDIDVLKRAVGAAEWARDYARATVEAVPVPLVVLDRQGTILSTNASLRDQYGVSEAASTNRSLYDILQRAFDCTQLRSAVSEVLSGRDFRELMLTREIPALGMRALSLSGRAVPLPGGERAVLLAITDITEAKEREAERALLLRDTEAAKAEAQAANRTKDQFLATLSHELRTPLASLMLQTQLLRRGPLEGERLERACDAIERATKAQAQLVDDLLDISRIVSGKLKMEMQAVTLAGVVKSAVDLTLPSAEKKQIRLSLEVEDSLPPISADPGRLEQAVLNLLTNAIKFTPNEGQIRVIVDSFQGRGRIRIKDTGIGIEPQFLPHVFSRFSQESRGHSRSHGGMGLGLAIVRYMVEAHGGTVEATSAGKSKGSEFTIILPLMVGQRDAVTGAARRQPSERPAPNLMGARVLLVEDDEGTRDAIGEMLGAAGAEVRTASSAAEAMQLLQPFKPAVLVSDIAMPEEDGYQFLTRVRALSKEEGGDVPALALTALAGDEDREHAFRAGFQAHLAKPVDIDRLLSALSRLLEHKRVDGLHTSN